ncbi:MAG: sporulation initiation factor Spo0A [Clostridia bacterium]|nr:sporulation initiation factor Spo0A [Clostridia bacterium]
MKEKTDAERAIRQLAMREGVTVEEVRRQMALAILAGLSDQDAAVQARWKKIPCKGEIPTPEELISYLAKHIDAGTDPFA